jgi:uncharacterized Fe-S cluster protein YjdI
MSPLSGTDGTQGGIQSTIVWNNIGIAEMAYKLHKYKGKDIVVSYDANRCIHASEWVSRLNAVLDTSRRHWIETDNAPAADVADTVKHCPTGALHFECSDGSSPEAIPSVNVVTQVVNGPLYVRGNIEVYVFMHQRFMHHYYWYI